ncbi:hypothetical protein AK88_01943 [Plasmodium fragile]|uniref:Uncharacterized protein n=1 Tax=Plasmodium fragile TaxID=5857 RepID=A0A0D9QNE8_PLAFR|nr:uncharacterized protein AK88_01943 [Plasmodium fragile]KJP88327.1 hypothetical protein AK88_01943 [Plasmodium fragile]
MMLLVKFSIFICALCFGQIADAANTLGTSLANGTSQYNTTDASTTVSLSDGTDVGTRGKRNFYDVQSTSSPVQNTVFGNVCKGLKSKMQANRSRQTKNKPQGGTAKNKLKECCQKWTRCKMGRRAWFKLILVLSVLYPGNVYLINFGRRRKLPQKQKKTNENRTPKQAEESEKQEVPKKQEAPKKPEAPKNPEVSKTQEGTKKQEAPGKPEVPKKSEAPTKPEVPNKSEIPQKPKTPEKQEASGKSDAPKKPEIPKKTEVPGKTEIPKKPEVLVKPESSAKSEVPKKADVLTKPKAPGKLKLPWKLKLPRKA